MKELQNKTDLILVGPSMGIPHVLKNLGIDPEPIILEMGLEMRLFDNPENIISFNERGRLLTHCVELTQCNHFGLLVGSLGGIHSLGVLGLLMQSCENVEEALQCLIRYYHFYIQGSTVSFKVEGSIVTLSYQINSSGTDGSKQVGAGAIALIYNILTDLCGIKWQAKDICLMQNTPTSLRPFRKVFHVTPIFNAEQNSVMFSSQWLKHPLPEVNPMIKSLLQNKVNTLKESLTDTLPDKVRRVLRAELRSNPCHIEHIAYVFSMKSRTFNRRLAEYGLQYKDLLDEVRFEFAKSMLEDTSLTIYEIATNLHYCDARSFIRAFKRWSDNTPACWRKSIVFLPNEL